MAISSATRVPRQSRGRSNWPAWRPGGSNIVVFQGSFHGRTVGTMSLTTSKTIYRAGFQPLMPGVFVSPFPYAYRYGWDQETTSQWCLDELELLLKSQTAPQETAAILIEPVLGEGGYVVPPESFLRGLRQLASKHGILVIADEVQSGFGRTGKWFGFNHFELEPDIVTIAKGLASGMPLSGVVAPLDLMAKWTPGSHGGTYGGNAVAAAAGAATIQVIKDEGLLQNAEARSTQLFTGLRKLQEEYSILGDVRGLGLMVGLEFRDAQHQPMINFGKDVAKFSLEQDLMLLTCGPWDNTIRLIPPLTVSETQIQTALEVLNNAIRKSVEKLSVN